MGMASPACRGLTSPLGIDPPDYHLPTGQCCSAQSTFTSTKHPHELQVRCSAPNRGHASQVASLASTVASSAVGIPAATWVTTALPKLIALPRKEGGGCGDSSPTMPAAIAMTTPM